MRFQPAAYLMTELLTLGGIWDLDINEKTYQALIKCRVEQVCPLMSKSFHHIKHFIGNCIYSPELP
jgi:hypothetical protein